MSLLAPNFLCFAAGPSFHNLAIFMAPHSQAPFKWPVLLGTTLQLSSWSNTFFAFSGVSSKPKVIRLTKTPKTATPTTTTTTPTPRSGRSSKRNVTNPVPDPNEVPEPASKTPRDSVEKPDLPGKATPKSGGRGGRNRATKSVKTNPEKIDSEQTVSGNVDTGSAASGQTPKVKPARKKVSGAGKSKPERKNSGDRNVTPANLNKKNQRGETPLQVACCKVTGFTFGRTHISRKQTFHPKKIACHLLVMKTKGHVMSQMFDKYSHGPSAESSND